MTWFDAARARLRLLLPTAETRIDEEISFHIEMETERLMREEGLDHAEATRRARVLFGGVQQHREELREGRGTAWLSGLSLDLKLGARMLAKYPGLTVIGGLAMAFGIWFGAVTFHMFGMITTAALPLPDGDRIVRIAVWDAKLLSEEDRSAFDYGLWRTARSLTDMGAYRDISANVVGADGSALPAAAVEISASAFRIAPEPPILGRVFSESDEHPGAAPVVLLGHSVWVRRYGSDPGIVGRSVQIGDRYATVIGVMPEGYAFPMAHELWMPLRTDVAALEPRTGPAINVFGRLAPGSSIENAQAELTGFGKRLAAEHPETHAQLQPHVLRYTQLGVNDDVFEVKLMASFFVIVLVLVVCSTVALLLFARAASRESEILVRSALGASRNRIVAQLFAEALVLAGVAAVVGLGAAQLSLTLWGETYLLRAYETTQLPFWYSFRLASTTVGYALGLAIIGAVMAGVMPARKITHGLGTRLRMGTAGGGTVRFGGVWTAVIVTQVALTVLLPSAVALVRAEIGRVEGYDAGFPTREYLGVTLGADSARIGPGLEALRQRLESEPDVAGVTFVDRLPGEPHIHRRVDLSLPNSPTPVVATAAVDPSYFDVLQAPIIAGRPFTQADVASGAHVAIVDQVFADSVMGGRNPIGHTIRLRTSQMPDSVVARLPRYEIIGLVKELGMSSMAMPQRVAGVYLPVAPGGLGAVNMIVHGRGDPLALAPRIRELALAVDPTMEVTGMTRLDQTAASMLWLSALWERIIIGLTAVALLLSLSGIYAVLAYTVARRTREIGVRVALGASARLIIGSIFRRPLIQVAMGVLAGVVLIVLAAIGAGNATQFEGTGVGVLTLGEIVLLVGYAVLMLGVCALACLVPTARALRVQPTEALRAE